MFTIGRVITFGMTGMAIVVVPIYQAETAPGPLRGMFASTIQLNIAIGTLIASVVILGTKAIDGNAAWLIPIGLQLPIPVIFLALIPLLPESPRWLLSRGRREEAAKNLRKLRNGVAEAELERELQALAYAHHNEQKGSWAEVFDKNNRVGSVHFGHMRHAVLLTFDNFSCSAARLLLYLRCSANRSPARHLRANTTSSSTRHKVSEIRPSHSA